MRTNYKRIKSIITHNFNVEDIIKSPTNGIVAVFVRNVDHVRIVLVDGYYGSNEQGIHLRQLNKSNLEHYLVDAINTALKDGFSTIYIHQSDKPSEDRRKRSIECVQKWMDNPNHVELRVSMSYLCVDPIETLESMTDEQLRLVCKIIGGMYQTGASSSREYWSPKYHALRKKLESLGIDTLNIEGAQ
jgi:hypothetical protein